MEEIEDFDDWFTNFKLPPVKFVAVFNPDTGAVISVGPSHAFTKKDSEIKKPDIYIKYDSKLAVLKIEMSTEFGGTRKTRAGIKKRNFVWAGDTEMQFFITEYNDPNLLFEVVTVTINDLIGKYKLITDFNYPKFSVYTRRLFKNYVIEYR